MALFNSNDKNQTAPRARQAAPATPGQVTMIGEGTTVEGTIQADNDVRLSGRLLGDVQAKGKVILTQEGVVEGSIVARSADVAGTIKGELFIDERLVLRSTARVQGNLRTNRLVTEEGALIDGTCDMSGSAKKGASVPTPTKGAAQASAGAKAA
ncbi:MAG: polymer-forming cytoskeletal protein [Bacteroidota bacterium]